MGQRRSSFVDVLTSALVYATIMIGGLYLYIFLGFLRRAATCAMCNAMRRTCDEDINTISFDLD